LYIVIGSGSGSGKSKPLVYWVVLSAYQLPDGDVWVPAEPNHGKTPRLLKRILA